MLYDTIETLIGLNLDAIHNNHFTDMPRHWRTVDSIPLEHTLQLAEAAASIRGCIDADRWLKVCNILHDYNKYRDITNRQRRYLTITVCMCIMDLAYHIFEENLL